MSGTRDSFTVILVRNLLRMICSARVLLDWVLTEWAATAMPDAINPSMVFRDRPELSDLFERTSAWIDKSLQRGNVLVHCQKGQKRSPTIVLAWLITRGYGTQEAINLISRSYTSSSYSVTEPSKSWGGKYRVERPLWVEVCKT